MLAGADVLFSALTARGVLTSVQARMYDIEVEEYMLSTKANQNTMRLMTRTWLRGGA